MDEVASRQRRAVAHLYHSLFTGLILTVVTRRNATDAATWVEALFRQQHQAKFLASFEKLGLSEMPPAVAAAAYHFHSNRIGGVDVEFMRESDTKAWVRFPPPRWIYPGATICGVPSEVSRAMLRGWYAENGRSLGVPGLQFVCTGQTTDAQAGLMGYFIEHHHAVPDAERMIFRPGEVAPRYDPELAPRLPDGQWPTERLEKARRNYAMEYHRNGIPLLFSIFGVAEASHLLRTACWLVGVQLAGELAAMLEIEGKDKLSVAELLKQLSAGEGNACTITESPEGIRLEREGLRLFRDLPPQPIEAFDAWKGLLEGIVAGHDRFIRIEGLHYSEANAMWRIN